MKTYLIINPFSSNASHGIHNYNTNLALFFDVNCIPYEIFSNDENLPPNKFRIAVKKYVESKYGYDEVLIEAPEVKASTLLLNKNYKTHIRLHTPGAIAQKYDGAVINEELFKEELEAIKQATFVSAPSYGIIKELEEHLNRNDFSVYKNPFNLDITGEEVSKKYDIVFMARFQKLKGIEFLNPILEKLPKDYKVLLFGNNAENFKLSKNIECTVELKAHISGNERFELLKNSKNILQISKFENCSMVILEGLACHTVVHAWDVGGNKEIADDEVLKISPYGDTGYLVHQLLSMTTDDQLKNSFKENLADIHKDFDKGLMNIINNHDKEEFSPYLGINKQRVITYNDEWLSRLERNSVSHNKNYKNFGQRIFGFSMSNEHIEEFWMPIIDKMGADYRFVCSRPLGFMYKFNNPFYVDPNKFTQYDWMRYPNILIEDIERFKPHKIYFHNGSHPMYYEVLNRIKKAFPNIPIVYSELGWFPQKDNIYFDIKGVNGLSSISKKDFQEFCGERPLLNENKEKLTGNVVIVTQLENDTNLIINSNRFKNMEKFVAYCISQIPEKEKIIVKLHPMENYPERFSKFESARVEIVHKGELSKILASSKAVIGINSTVLLESLQYKTNIYFFGQGVISNKGIAIDCTDPSISLRSVWTDSLYSSMKNRIKVVDAFKKLQIHIPSLSKYTIAECLELPGFTPLMNSTARYSNGEEFEMLIKSRTNTNNKIINSNSDVKKDIEEIKDIIAQMPLKILSQMTESSRLQYNPKEKNEINKFRRKVRKLKKNPYQFFNDSDKLGSKFIARLIIRKHRK